MSSEKRTSILKLLFFCCILFSCFSIAAQETPSTSLYQSRADLIYNNINQYLKDHNTGLYYEGTAAKQENPHSWLWPLCALIQATNEMEIINPAGNYMKPVERAIQHYYSTVKPTAAYQDYVIKERLSSRFYDDNQWIALAYLDAYTRTKNKSYYTRASEIYRFLLTGYDQEAGGGMYWKEGDFKTKNTCSNGPNILVSLKLYEITKAKKYLDTALLVYAWTNEHLQAREGYFYDAIRIPSLKIDSGAYTYNTGTMLQANVLLYQITRSKKYLQEAKRIADAGEKRFYKNGRLPGHYWFNAVFLRGYQELYLVEGEKKRLQFIIDDAERVWREERDEKNFLGRGENKTLLMQAGMMEIYARLAELNL